MAKRRWMILLGIACAGIGVATALPAWREHRRGLASPDWPRARATVLAAALIERQRDYSTPQRRFVQGTDRARLHYEYTVGVRRYRGSGYAVGREAQGALAHDAIARHPRGSQADVYFDPADPSYAVLYPGPSGARLFLWPAAAGAAALGLLLLGWFGPARSARTAVHAAASGSAAEAWRAPIQASFVGVRGVPLLALAHNSIAPLLELHAEHLVGRVLLRFERPYVTLQRVEALTLPATRNLVFEWHGEFFSFVANLRDDATRLRVLRELERRGVPLGDAARRLLAADQPGA